MVSLVLTGCVPKKDKVPDETETTVEETVENKTNEKYQVYEGGDFPEGKKMVLFFHADWCPTCRNWETKLLEKVDILPEEALVYKVDYDKELELRAKHGVTKQSSAVFVDSSGKVRKISKDPSVEALAHFFNQVEIVEKPELDPDRDKYLSYSPARAEGQKVALFFHADWCATCRKWEEDLKSQLSKLPENARVLKVDYDNAKELVKDYGVTKQSTVVFLDEKGNVAKKLMDPSLDKVIEFFGGKVEKKKETKEVEKKKKVKEPEVKEKESTSDNTDPINDDEKDSVVEESAKEEKTEEPEVAPEIEDSIELESEAVAPARYEAYSAGAVKAEEGKKYILNFSASWCPNCRKLNSEIEGMLGSLADGTVIFKTDYDQYTDLKKQYGVTQQTTLVFVNADGSFETKPGGTLDDIKAFFN